MGLLTKYGTSPLSSFSDAPDIVYGTGNDGSVTFDGTTTILSMAPSSSVYSLTRDIYCYNMTVGDSVRIQPNGYRIFVKNELVMTQASIIGFSSGFSGSGSIAGGGTGAVTHSLGGENGDDPGFSATPPTSSLGGSNYYRQAINATRGYAITADGGPVFLRGGAGNGSQSGGGVVICAARYITFSGPGTTGQFKAPATPSTANGGGVVLTISTSASLPANITVDVGGGTNGIYSGGNGNHFHIQAV
jgi:hypothetical protein